MVASRLVLNYFRNESSNSFVKSKNDIILIIGGGGFIGSSLIEKLLDKNIKIRVLDFFMYGENSLDKFKANPNLQIQRGDFRNIVDLHKSMANVSTVIHLGGIVGDPACAIDEEYTIEEINLVATKLIMDVMKSLQIKRLIFASTCSVYGASNDIMYESSPFNPVSLYARSKIGSEKIIIDYMEKGHIDATIVRFGTIYGFSGRTRFDLVINLLTAKAFVEKEIPLFGGDQ